MADVSPTRADADALLAPTAYERARILAPFVLFAMLSSFVLSEPTGIPLTLTAIIWNVMAIPALGVLCVALWRRRVPVEHGHGLIAVVWWFSVIGTLLSLYLSGQAARIQALIFVEVCFLAILLQRRTLIASLALFDAIWLPAYVRELGADPVYLSAMFIAQLAVVLFQHLHCNALLRAEITAAELAKQLDEGKRLQDQLLHSRRMESIGTLAAGLAHDMNNILGSITNMSELLLDGASELSRADLQGIIKQSARGAELTRGLLAFSRKGHYRKLVVDLDRQLEEVTPLLARTLPKSLQIRTRFAATHANVLGDPAHLQQMIVNLAVNSADAMNGPGVLELCSDRITLGDAEAAALQLPAGAYALITVRDSGVGMDDETRKRAFEPFFTTKARGKGTGLGLSTVWGIVHSHGGSITIDSAPGRGATFSIYLPLTSAAAVVAAPVTPPTIPDKTRRTTVLVVDDEDAVRASTIRLLQRKGLDAIGAADGQEALRVFAEHESEIGLVILDMGMPHMGGRECFEQLRKTSKVPVLIATGYAIDADMRALTAQGAALIEKPYPANVLAREVIRLLEAN